MIDVHNTKRNMIHKRSFTRPVRSGQRPPSRFSGGNKNFKKNNNRPSKKGRFGSERIDFSRFIKKNVYVEEKPYISKHTFADFPFHPQLHKNISKT
ncbi:MAG: hypothetical protein AAB902_00210, partial [Patescibacteria group bacterium]